MATEQELNCIAAKARWSASSEDFAKSAELAVTSHQKITNDHAYVARQKQVLDEINVKLTYLNEKIDARKTAIGKSSDPVEIQRLQSEIAALDGERDDPRARRTDIESEIATIQARDEGNRRLLANGKDGISKYYAELQEAQQAIANFCGKTVSLPEIPSL